jgi:hypothetical protein
MRVLTSNYQAEYGRNANGVISLVTKGGSRDFHGSAWANKRHEMFNAKNFFDNLNGRQKSVYRFFVWGYSIGGPIGKPGGSNKLFFFYSQEFSPRTQGNDVQRWRFPTAAERQGDFSQTLDQNGVLYNFIKDPLVAGTCSATDTTACFKDGGVLGKIPADRLYSVGLNVLKQYPMPNAGGRSSATTTGHSASQSILSGSQQSGGLMTRSTRDGDARAAAAGRRSRTAGSTTRRCSGRASRAGVLGELQPEQRSSRATAAPPPARCAPRADGNSPTFCRNAIDERPLPEQHPSADCRYFSRTPTTEPPTTRRKRRTDESTPPSWVNNASRAVFRFGSRKHTRLIFHSVVTNVDDAGRVDQPDEGQGSPRIKTGFFNAASRRSDDRQRFVRQPELQ